MSIYRPHYEIYVMGPAEGGGIPIRPLIAAITPEQTMDAADSAASDLHDVYADVVGVTCIIQTRTHDESGQSDAKCSEVIAWQN